MQISRILLTAVLTLSWGVLAGCGGDDDDSDSGGSPSSDNPGQVLDEGNCDVKVDVTGGVSASWTGDGSSTTKNTGGPDAFYQAGHDDAVLSLYSDGDGFDANAILQVGDDYYGAASLDDLGTLDIATDGSSAQVEQDIAAVGDPDKTAHLVGTFTC